MIAVVPVRAGAVVVGGEAALDEAGGRAILLGRGAYEAAEALQSAGRGRDVAIMELGDFEPARWAQLVAPHIRAIDTVVLPATPDGRDLAPRIAMALDRQFLGAALRVNETKAWLLRMQGRQVVVALPDQRFVATLVHQQPAPPLLGSSQSAATEIRILSVAEGGSAEPPADPELLRVIEAAPAAIDLAEASRIFAAGAGIGTSDAIRLLESVAGYLQASVGATRVVTDAGLLGHERQIGTTGVAVNPRCYVAFAVSGAAQHIGGLAPTDHVIAVNLDPSCPMMMMADLGLVTDAGALLEELAARLGGDDA